MEDKLAKDIAKSLGKKDILKKDTKKVLKNIEKQIQDNVTSSSTQKPKQKSKRSTAASSTNVGGEGDANKMPKLKSSHWSFKNVDGFFMPEVNLKQLSLSEQEQILIRDLIYAFSGVPSTYIQTNCNIDELGTMNVNNVNFKISDNVNLGHAKLVHELLPMIAYFVTIRNFVEESILLTYCGQVRQAYSAALSKYVGDYYDKMASIETELNAGQLNLTKFVFTLMPTIACMKVFADIVCQIRDDKMNGARILDYLYDNYEKFVGDNDVNKFLSQLLSAAAVPYMEIMATWLRKGFVDDPQHDFFIVDNDKKNSMSEAIVPEHCNADYWSLRYHIHQERLPKFLLKHKQMIFNTGKYMNVLRQCGVQIDFVATDEVVFVPESNKHVTVIKQYYDYAAKKMLDVMRKDYNILAHLRAIKRYMLMQNSDLIAAFLDECDEELDKNAEEVKPTKVQRLFFNALNISSLKQDPYNENVKCHLLDVNLVEQLSKICSDFHVESDMPERSEQASEQVHLQINGYEAFSLSYNVKWPLTLIHDRGTLEKLQLIFRELFYLKHAQFHLSKLWNLPRSKYLQTTKAYSLRHRMLNTFVNIEYFMLVDVIEPKWANFIKTIEKAENIDQLQTAYKEFIDNTLMLGLLMESSTFMHTIFTIGSICLNFSNFVETCSHDMEHEDFDQTVDEYDKEFVEMVSAIVELLKEFVRNIPNAYCFHLLKRLEFINAYMVHVDGKGDGTPTE